MAIDKSTSISAYDERWTERKRKTDEGYTSPRFQATPDHQRSEAQYQRDRARIIHCAAFRRLQSKTQVLNLGESDFYRTRLTHSLEVAQLGSGICSHLLQSQPQWRDWIPSAMLMEAICLAHDLGHPPFGHGGETALNSIMCAHGGFEGNGQTLRIAMKLGEYSESHGLDLTRRTLLGVLKYPSLHQRIARYPNASQTDQDQLVKPPKCLHDEEAAALAWLLAPFSESDQALLQHIDFPAQPDRHGKTRYKGFDTSIMELADDIAYGVHDLEDAVALRLVTQAQWQSAIADKAAAIEWPHAKDQAECEQLLAFASRQLFLEGDKPRKHAISRIVHFLMERIHIEHQGLFASDLLNLQAVLDTGAEQLLKLHKDLVMQFVILRPQIQELEFKGQQIIRQLMHALLQHPTRLLPLEQQQLLEQGADLHRTVCDYVASMTDLEASRRYSRLFAPNVGSVFAP